MSTTVVGETTNDSVNTARAVSVGVEPYQRKNMDLQVFSFSQRCGEHVVSFACRICSGFSHVQLSGPMKGHNVVMFLVILL